MASKKEILKKIRILITQKFDDPEAAFKFFDKNQDGFLEKEELKELIRNAEINRFLSSIIASKMLKGLDADQNQKFDWKEFRKAVNDLIIEGVNEESK
jgi:Ca2+-binding EF-hand superfamily protein